MENEVFRYTAKSWQDYKNLYNLLATSDRIEIAAWPSKRTIVAQYPEEGEEGYLTVRESAHANIKFWEWDIDIESAECFDPEEAISGTLALSPSTLYNIIVGLFYENQELKEQLNQSHV